MVHASSGKVSLVIVLVVGLVEVHPTKNFSCETHFVSSKKILFSAVWSQRSFTVNTSANCWFLFVENCRWYAPYMELFRCLLFLIVDLVLSSQNLDTGGKWQLILTLIMPVITFRSECNPNEKSNRTTKRKLRKKNSEIKSFFGLRILIYSYLK